jgi:hypothetical protein
MSNERIDLTQIEAFLEEAGPEAGGTYVYDLLTELKRCYEKLDSQHRMISELIEANTVKGEILDTLRICDECGEKWDYHLSGADCEADRQQASE